MSRFNYQWDPYHVQTADGWTLTVFHIKAKRDFPSKKKKLPILLMHGALDDALSWARRVRGTPTGVVKLVERGYDVFMINNRGTRYSNMHERDGEWSLEEKWD